MDFLSNFICPLGADDSLQTRRECERRETRRLTASPAAKRKNDDVPSSLNHGGFRDELSC